MSLSQEKKLINHTDANKEQVEKQLQKILASSHFKSAKKMQMLLSYIVHKALAGDAKLLKQYTIAVDALGYSDDFDADANPAIRILAGRVRERLDNYYKDTAVDNSIIISIPKGSYAPKFEEVLEVITEDKPQSFVAQTNTDDNHASMPRMIKHPKFWLLLASLLVVSTIAIKLFSPKQQENNTSSSQLSTYETPFVNVMPFENLSNNMSNDDLTKGIRYQLISDLSQFPMIRVRDVKDKKVHPYESSRKHADYQLNGALINTGEFIKTTLILNNTMHDEVIWSKEVKVLASDKGFNQLIYDGIKAVVTKMTSPAGMMHLGAMKRLRSRLEQDESSSTSSYECIVLYYAYDLSKDVNDEKAARKCLREATDQNIPNSTLWAAHGLMLYFEWTKSKDAEKENLYIEAISATRKAIKLDPLNALAHQNYGSLIMAKNENKEALKSFETAIKLSPSNPEGHILAGWARIQQGDWDNGIKKVREGIAISYLTPGWFRIPLAVDAFRREDFDESLKQAQEIYASGDKRGIILALAAAIKLNNTKLIERYSKDFAAYRNDDKTDPLRVISHNLKAPDVLEQYTETVMPILKSFGFIIK